MTLLAELDANYVLDVTYERSKVMGLLEELGKEGIQFEVRLGTSVSNVYIFIRDQDERLPRWIAENEVVKNVVPLYGAEGSKRLDFLCKSMLTQVFPSTKNLVDLARLTQNPEMALYFAFQKTYTQWLLPLGVFGFFFRVISKVTPWEFNIGYAIVLLAWGMSFALVWKLGVEPRYARMFGTARVSYGPDPRPVFLKKLVFIPVALTFAAILVGFQFLCFSLEIYITQLYEGPLVSVLSLLPTIAISAFTPVLTLVYNVFVEKLVKWEKGVNPERSRVEKNFVLKFLTSYVPLFITLFVYLPMGHKLNPHLGAIANYSKKYKIPVNSKAFKINTQRYQVQYFYFIVTNQLVGIGLENLLPFVLGKLMPIITGQTKPNSEFNRSCSLVSSKYPRDAKILADVRHQMNNPWGVFNLHDNVSKLVTQFGYIMMFSIIWPLAPLICVILNFIISRFDIWRSLKLHTPQWNNRTDAASLNLSPWNSLLEFFSWIASLISPALIIMYRHSNLPGVGLASVKTQDKWFTKSPIIFEWKLIFVYVIIAEHIGIFFRYILYNLISAPSQNTQETIKIQTRSLGKTKNEEVAKDVYPVIRETDWVMDILRSNNSNQNNPTANKLLGQKLQMISNNANSTSDVELHVTAPSSANTARERPSPVTSSSIPVTPQPRNPNRLSHVPNEDHSNSSGSVTSSVAGATLPRKIPTSKNYDERAGLYSAPKTPEVEVSAVEISSSTGKHEGDGRYTFTTADPSSVEDLSPPQLPPKDYPRAADQTHSNSSKTSSRDNDFNSYPPTVTHKKSNSFKGITKFIGSPAKKEHNGNSPGSTLKTKSKSKKSPLNMLKKKN